MNTILTLIFFGPIPPIVFELRGECVLLRLIVLLQAKHETPQQTARPATDEVRLTHTHNRTLTMVLK